MRDENVKYLEELKSDLGKCEDLKRRATLESRIQHQEKQVKFYNELVEILNTGEYWKVAGLSERR